MKTETDCTTDRLQVGAVGHTEKYRRRITGILLALVCLLAATVAQAQKDGDLDAAMGYDSNLPWMPEVLASGNTYVPDPGFNGGRLGLDHFAAANSLDQFGLATAELANGDMVVAGLVPDGISGGVLQ